MLGLLLMLATFLAYQQVWHAGFIWDDDAHVTRSELRSWHGLWRIWFEPGATQQFYPVLYSVFWLEHQLWGEAASGYHLVNVLWHGIAACLLYRVLRRLAVPGALLAAAAFALHPVCAESVAWISEQKNTLSAVFYFSAALVYLRYDQGRRIGSYALGLGLFGLAVLSKSVTATLPAALLVVFWWKRGRISWKGDVLPLVPWLIVGVGAGATTAWMEKTFVGATGAVYELGFVERCLVAGRALWFYAAKIFWPFDLNFMYPRWTLNAREFAQYFYPVATLGLLGLLFVLRKRSRGPLAVALLFVGTLFPALGFINVYPFVYSYVADHFQYLGAAILLSAAAAALTFCGRLLLSGRRALMNGAAVCLLASLGWLTCRQSAMYADLETLWRTTIARNPSCWMAYNNLGAFLLESGRVEEAIKHIQTALKFGPDNAAAYTNLGDALRQQGRLDASFAQYNRALAIEPGNPVTHANLGTALLQAGRVEEAMAHYRTALEIKPDFARARTNLGDAFLRSGRFEEAMASYRRALENDPDSVEAHVNYGTALAQSGRVDDAITQYEVALAIRPVFFTARLNLGNALLQAGQVDAAILNFKKALEINPASAQAHENLGRALLKNGRADEADVQFQEAARLK